MSPSLVLGRLADTGFAPAEAAIVLISAVNNMCLDVKPDASHGRVRMATPARCDVDVGACRHPFA